MVTLLFVLLGSSPAPAAQAASPSPSSDKYREVVYPQGLPVRENEFTGRQQRVVYALLGEAPVTGTGRTAILYSERNPVEQGDQVYHVYVAILDRGASGLRLVDQREVTESLPVYTEFPGHVYEVDGCLDAFAVKPGVPVLHAHAWAVLSGTGSTSGASDLFLVLADSGKLQVALELKGTSRYSRTGADDVSGTVATIRLVEADGGKDIVVEEQVLTAPPAPSSTNRRPPARYRFAGGRFEPRTEARPPASGAGGTVLCRSARIAAPAVTPAAGAPR